MTPQVRLPAGPVTPHGAYHILNPRTPQVNLAAYDESVVLHLMGGLAIPDRTAPERVELKGITGLVPPWTPIDQKGATQDGVTFVDALYEPIEVTADVVCHGRNPQECRKVVNYLIGSLDVKQQSRLSWFTHEMGYWWAPLRWFRPPDSGFRQSKRQPMSLRLRADSGFWQSYPDVAEFRFAYETTKDEFSTDQDPLGSPGWTTNYTGTGTGHAYIVDNQIKSDMEDDRTLVARRASFTTATNNQVVEIQLGAFGEWLFPNQSGFDVWVRQANSGTPGLNGIRVRFGRHYIQVSSFNAGVETVLRQRLTIIPPLPGEKFTIIAGTPAATILGHTIPAEERKFRVLRNGATIMNFKESGTTSQLGSGFRSVGFGLFTDSPLSPPFIQRFTAGDNSSIDQTGFIRRINAGDQPMWDRYTCFGPGIFRIGNGPGSTDMVEFGPLLPGQVVQLRTDPRKRGVVDLTSTPPTPQHLNIFQRALQDIFEFASGGNTAPLFQEILSLFGVLPPQGNLYALLDGRWSNPIPPKSPGLPSEQYYINVAIDEGNADSKIIAAGTPLRRNPY